MLLKLSVGVAVVAVVGVLALRAVVSPTLGPLQPVDLNGTTAIITGASAGIGHETARVLLSWGADVILACRNLTKGNAVLADIRRTTGKTGGEVWELDLASFASVDQFVRKFVNSERKLNLLINNAGMVRVNSRVTDDGIDEMYQANVLSPFLLTNALLLRLKQSAPSRIVHVSSEAHTWGNLSSKWDAKTKGVGPAEGGFWGDYGTTKLMNILLSNEFARRLHGTGVTSNALHPGVVATDIGQEASEDMGTRFQQAFFKRMSYLIGRDTEDGAKTTLYVATSPELDGISGAYFKGYAKTNPAPAALNETLAAEIWKTSAQLTGLGQ